MTATSSTAALRPLDSPLATSLSTGRLAGLPQLQAATAVDAALVQAMRLVVRRFLLPENGHVDALRRSAAPYLAPALLDAPGRFFDLPSGTAARLARSRTVRVVRGGAILSHRLATDLAPDDLIRLAHWVQQGRRPRATVLAVHGFTMGWPRLDAIALLASEWFRAGLDVALLTLPYHGARTPAGATFSGEAFARPDVAALNAAALGTPCTGSSAE